MKLITLVLAAISATAIAQSPGFNDVSSDGFRLILKSDNSTLDGSALGACHQGAAIEGLCLTGEKLTDPASSYTTFYHNVSSVYNDTAGASNTTGVLWWLLRAGNFEVPSAMSISPSLDSNIANPTFFPGQDDYTLVAFKDCDNMYIKGYTDDTVSPPAYWDDETSKLENWYICLTRYSYLYTTLSWKVGVTGEPQNPSCQKVEVKRVFV